MAPTPAKVAVVEGNLIDAGGPATEGMKPVFGGGIANPLTPLGLIIAPVALATDAAHCVEKLEAAYPGLQVGIAEIAQREFVPADVQDQFVTVLQQGASVPVAREAPLLGDDESAGERRLLALAAQHGRAHLFLIEISSLSIRPYGKGCDSWKVWAKMQVQLWRVADSRLVLSFSPGYPQPSATGPLAEIKAVFDEPGALRSRLKETYEATATMFFYRAMFQLPQ